MHFLKFLEITLNEEFYSINMYDLILNKYFFSMRKILFSYVFARKVSNLFGKNGIQISKNFD